MPSVAPSQMPSVTPSAIPTDAPAQLSHEPTVAPTRTPSAKPSSAVPTIAPTPQASPIVEFQTSVTLTNLASLDLSAADQQSVVEATATSMGVASSTLTYVTTNPTTRRLTAWGTAAVNGISVMNAAIPLDSTSYTSTDALYSGVNANLQTAITNNDYTTALQSYSAANGATNTANADGAAASSTPAIVVNPSSDNDDDELTDGQIAGIVIGTIFGFAILCAAVYYILFYFVMEGGSMTFPSIGSARSTSGTSRQRREDVEIAL